MNLSIDAGLHVVYMQRTLKLEQPQLEIDGLCGPRTRAALRRFEERHGLPVSQDFGGDTWAALVACARDARLVTPEDMTAAARRLNIRVPALLGLFSTESEGIGFLPDGRVKILFERHIMYRRLVARALPAQCWRSEYPDLVGTIAGGWLGGAREYERFDAACALDRDCAIEACSWGLFQILGLHWRFLGYSSASAFAASMAASECDQLEAFVRFVERDTEMLQALQHGDWEAFARRYNGPDFRAHGYDARLAAAVAHFESLAGRDPGAAR